MTDWRTEICVYCDGHGLVSDYRGGDFNGAMECSECNGSGRIWISPQGRIADYPGGPFRGQISTRVIKQPKNTGKISRARIREAVKLVAARREVIQ